MAVRLCMQQLQAGTRVVSAHDCFDESDLVAAVSIARWQQQQAAGDKHACHVAPGELW